MSSSLSRSKLLTYWVQKLKEIWEWYPHFELEQFWNQVRNWIHGLFLLFLRQFLGELSVRHGALIRGGHLKQTLPIRREIFIRRLRDAQAHNAMVFIWHSIFLQVLLFLLQGSTSLRSAATSTATTKATTIATAAAVALTCSEEDMQAFLADSFVLGKIPECPPPLELCWQT